MAEKLRVLLFPFFAPSHMEPFTDLAIRLVAAGPSDAVEATAAVTPPHRPVHHDALTSPAQEALLRALSPDAIVTDAHFAWNVRLARELGVPCVAFSAIGAFSMLAMRHLQLALAGGDAAGVADGGDDDAVDRGRPPVPGPSYYTLDDDKFTQPRDCFGVAINTSSDLEQHYCEMYLRDGHANGAIPPPPGDLFQTPCPRPPKRKRAAPSPKTPTQAEPKRHGRGEFAPGTSSGGRGRIRTPRTQRRRTAACASAPAVGSWWSVTRAGDGLGVPLGVPCVAFSAIGAFSTLALHHLEREDVDNGDVDVATVPQFPGPSIRVPRAELPEFLRGRGRYSMISKIVPVEDCFCQAMNTSLELERQYCEMYMLHGYAKRAYFVGPLFSSSSPSHSPAGGVDDQQSPCIGWLDSKPGRSVVYLCFGSLTHVSDAQLHQLALGLEAAGKPVLWVVRDTGNWTPPEGGAARVGDRGLLVTAWAPQTAILGHPAVGAFVTHCGWNSVLETVMAGVPVLTWPMVFEQFITERLVTEVLGIGERLWPCGAGLRSTRHEEHEVVPAGDVARAVTAFMLPGGAGDAARSRVMDLAAKCRAAVAEGGSSHRDLRRLVDDLMEARAKKNCLA
ncbi:UDP-glycosyltransferase 73C5 [Triticum urartu]|uniref:UDP-glycosyltransferase 73C5 n=1 Tax=Triticum urartu TaxID=4572 RepID=M7Z6X6_TRIUA|nr:UDP-glycosyltransferase 73C5 [Triticum urartu]